MNPIEIKRIMCVDCKPDVPCIVIANRKADFEFCPVSGAACNWVKAEEPTKRFCSVCGATERQWATDMMCKMCESNPPPSEQSSE